MQMQVKSVSGQFLNMYFKLATIFIVFVFDRKIQTGMGYVHYARSMCFILCSTMTLNVNQIDSLIYKLIKNDDKKRASSWHRGRGTCPNYLILIHACLSNENYSLTLSCPVNRGAYCCVAQWETGLLFSESS